MKPEVSTVYARGEIDSSLFLAAKRAGLSHNLTMDLANVFGYDIDFALDIRKGDSFEVIYEEKTVEGQRVGTGNILAARFTNRGKTYSAVRYTSKDGTTSYYNADGTSMRKAFIRTPVDFARISSRFSNGRKHPILNKIRAHKGVDYAAPHGTPIKSAGDGKVLLAGRKGLRQYRDHPARPALSDPLRAHAGLRQRRTQRFHREAGPDHRVYRDHRTFHRTAPALRVPGRRCPRRPTRTETANGRPDRQERDATFHAAEPTPDGAHG